MSTASMPALASISARIASVHGSAPKMPTSRLVDLGSIPWRASSSTSTCMYEGVTMMMFGFRSVISWTCFSVWPPDIGITVQPARSAP